MSTELAVPWEQTWRTDRRVMSALLGIFWVAQVCEYHIVAPGIPRISHWPEIIRPAENARRCLRHALDEFERACNGSRVPRLRVQAKAQNKGLEGP